MFILLVFIALFAIVIIAGVAGWWHNRKLKQQLAKGEIDEIPEPSSVDTECCGQHETCEKDSLLAAVSKQIEYYNDEELDRFRGRHGDEYNEEESDEFREILYTMRDDEVAGWVRSLQLRYVELPDDVKDEVLLIVGERR